MLAPGEVGRNPTSRKGVKADSTDAAGLLVVFEDTLAPWQSGPSLHLHTLLKDEAFYVLEGALLVRIGDEQHGVAASAFV